MDSLSIVLASEHHIDRVMTLVAACIADMRKAGIDQWDDVYPDRQTMLQDARDGSLYLASVDEEPLVGTLVGTLVVNDVQSPEYLDVPWTMTGERIAVVHRLMIDPRYQRQGIARELMRFAEQRAAALGCDCVRLDAYSKNPRALELYRRLGYHDAGSVTFRKGVFRCFEKKLVAARFQPLKEHR
jgi:ribosomal protein S18 acetylase RimI-like enzyme